MQLVANVSIPREFKEMVYVIDKPELLKLRSTKFLLPWQYIGLAIKISYTQSSPSIDIESFCDEWGIEEADFHSAIATLNKKKLAQPTARQLELDLLFDVEDDEAMRTASDTRKSPRAS
ncbi:hypothetical protein [Coleofasciculus sp. FACHB-T130]|uniref:hypothetical protein n=1 Tax=Cyanophyceae TaxID=3028117 RepID=UPI001682E1FE|nr:hypothetical protein [Coleofasciculus sp. FACHB-T130]MBD1878371.1 hypothetical protein [Coleofasciculus sp. FACHB-T130]